MLENARKAIIIFNVVAGCMCCNILSTRAVSAEAGVEFKAPSLVDFVNSFIFWKNKSLKRGEWEF
jgi:hypothetical protein